MIWAIICGATILRLVLINQSLWLDESIEALALQGHFGNIWGYALSDFQPPLYHLLLLAWTRLAGLSEIALRIPSLLASLGTVFYLYQIGRTIRDRRAGYLAALLGACNPLLIYYATEGRTYALTTFFVTASMYYLIKINSTSSPIAHRPSTISYVLFTTLYLWTSYLSWFLWFGLAVYLGLRKKWRLLGLHALAAATLIGWLPSFIRSLGIGMQDATLVPGWGQVVGGASLKALLLTWVKFSLGRISFVDKVVYAGITLGVALVHMLSLRPLRTQRLDLTIWIWLLVPVVLGLGISLVVPAYSYTRVLFVLPAYLLLLALGVSRLRGNLLPVALLLIQCLALGYYWVTPRFHKEAWRTLAADLQADVAGEIVLPSVRQDAALRYYLPDRQVLNAREATGRAERVYYIVYVEDAFDPAHLGRERLRTLGYAVTSQKVYPGLQLDIYQKLTP